jgi:anti-anti-sigma factor
LNNKLGERVRVKIIDKDPVVIVSVDGSILQEHIQIFRDRLEYLLESKKYWIVIDMYDAEYLSSMGLSIILDVKKRLNENRGEVVFANVNYLIKNLFCVTELLKKLDIFDSVESAVKFLKNRIDNL